MNKLVSTAVLSGFAAFTLISGTAYAWTYGLSGKGTCQTDGSFKITWTVDNTSENEALKITSSSNPTVVAVNTMIPAHQKSNYNQTADGTKPGNFSLTLKGNWPSDSQKRERTANVELKEACKQPTPPVTPPAGQGGQVQAAQVSTVPVGAVPAGNGGAVSKSAIAITGGLIASLAAISVGIRRLAKLNF